MKKHCSTIAGIEEKNKKIKYQIYARQGYVAPKSGVAQLDH